MCPFIAKLVKIGILSSVIFFFVKFLSTNSVESCSWFKEVKVYGLTLFSYQDVAENKSQFSRSKWRAQWKIKYICK